MFRFITTIKDQFENEGYSLLSEEYINNKHKLESICPNKHTYSVTWNHWTSGRRCPCKSGLMKPSIRKIRKSFESEGYSLLSTVYINAHGDLNYVCPYGHRHSVSWNRWHNQSHRCPTCFYVRNSGPNNCQWKGGLANEPYCSEWSDKEYKESIKSRDNYECQNPNCWKNSISLVVHHIDYNKKNCRPLNLITLCNSCNSRANSRRDYHMTVYRDIVMDK